MPETYSAENVIMTINGTPLLAPAEGSFISVEFSEEKWEHAVGAQGDVTIEENLDKTGTVTVTLQQNSQTRRLLDSLYRNGNEVVSTIKNLNSGGALLTGYICTGGRVERPDGGEEYSDELPEIEYELKFAKIEPLTPGDD